MNRNREIIEERATFVKLAINRPGEAAKQLRKTANDLSKCHKTTETVRQISKALFMSESQIFNDLKR